MVGFLAVVGTTNIYNMLLIVNSQMHLVVDGKTMVKHD